jgi:Zn-dependent M28 family amino/carboxypeptidase
MRDVTTALPRSTRGRPWIVGALVCAVALGACQALPPPTVRPASATPPPTPSAVPTFAAPDPALATALRDAIDTGDILAGLDRLQQIADEHDGNRAAGTSGHEASVEFVAGELRAAGYEVQLLPVALQVFLQAAPSALQIDAPGGAALEDLRDFKAMTFSASGDVTATVFALGFNRDAKPGDRSGHGCTAAEWAGVPAGVIVLLQPGPCTRHDAVVHAQQAGAVAVVTAYADWPRDHVLRPTLIEPADITIPVIGATHAVGLALDDAAAAGASVHLATHTVVEQRSSANVVAETPGGDAANVLMLGGHLDSVIDGPGINDDGSGAMTVLEIASELAALAAADPATAPRWKVRIALWTGEELGLFGSAAYARGLGNQRNGPIRAYLNFDMLGSRNGIHIVYDGSVTSRPAEGAAITGLFTTALDAARLSWGLEAVGAVSDHYPLEQLGIPVGGLYSGANELKSADQATTFGGTPDAPMDDCYHIGCDTRENVDPELLEQLARAAAWVTGALASGEVTLR